MDSEGFNAKPLVDPQVFFGDKYNSKKRFISYWHQINEISKLGPGCLLEIGIGNGFVSNVLKEMGYEVVTLDIDEKLKPEIVGSILDIPAEDNSYDVVACFEVLEHLPYEYFHKAMLEIRRTTSRYSVISVPDRNWFLAFSFQVPRLRGFSFMLNLRRLIDRDAHFVRHYWEIGLRDYPLSRILIDIRKAGFEVRKTYRVFENPGHRFFVLERCQTAPC